MIAVLQQLPLGPSLYYLAGDTCVSTRPTASLAVSSADVLERPSERRPVATTRRMWEG